MNQQEILSQIQPTFLKLREIIDASSDFFNRPPSYGGWTPGQCTRHIQMSIGGIAVLLDGQSDQKRLPANEKVPLIISIFLNFDKKFNAPEFIVPENKEFDPGRFRDFFQQMEKDLLATLNGLDLEYLVKGFEVPGMGPMTRLELLAFALFHTQRHIRQIEKMLEDFNASTF